MREIIARTSQLLREAGYTVAPAGADGDAILFEDPTVIGFAIEFPNPDDLIQSWEARLLSLTSSHEMALRRSREKSWNAYAVLLCEDEISEDKKAVLQSIEENLSGTRKIVRSGLPDNSSLTQALLPLLPLQGAPELPVVDMEAEIRSRTKELSDEVLRAFFSEASEMIALQIIEEAT